MSIINRTLPGLEASYQTIVLKIADVIVRVYLSCTRFTCKIEILQDFSMR